MAAKCLYAILLAFAWQEDECFPGQERLAEAAGCTDRTVRKYLEELKEFGMVSWVQRGLNQTNIYYIHDLNRIGTLKPLPCKDRKELFDIRILSKNNVVVEDGQQNKNPITKDSMSSTVENDGAAFDLPGSVEEESCGNEQIQIIIILWARKFRNNYLKPSL